MDGGPLTQEEIEALLRGFEPEEESELEEENAIIKVELNDTKEMIRKLYNEFEYEEWKRLSFSFQESYINRLIDKTNNEKRKTELRGKLLLRNIAYYVEEIVSTNDEILLNNLYEEAKNRLDELATVDVISSLSSLQKNTYDNLNSIIINKKIEEEQREYLNSFLASAITSSNPYISNNEWEELDYAEQYGMIKAKIMLAKKDNDVEKEKELSQQLQELNNIYNLGEIEDFVLDEDYFYKPKEPAEKPKITPEENNDTIDNTSDAIFTIKEANEYFNKYEWEDGKLYLKDTTTEVTDEAIITKYKAYKFIENESDNLYDEMKERFPDEDTITFLTDLFKVINGEIKNKDSKFHLWVYDNLINTLLEENGHYESLAYNLNGLSQNLEQYIVSNNYPESIFFSPKKEYALAYLKILFQEKKELILEDFEISTRNTIINDQQLVQFIVDYKLKNLNQEETEERDRQEETKKMHNKTGKEKLEFAKEKLKKAEQEKDEEMIAYWTDVITTIESNLNIKNDKKEYKLSNEDLKDALNGDFSVEAVNYFVSNYTFSDNVIYRKGTNIIEEDEKIVLLATAAYFIYNESALVYNNNPKQNLNHIIESQIKSIKNNSLLNDIINADLNEDGYMSFEEKIYIGPDKRNIRETIKQDNSEYAYLLHPKYDFALAYIRLQMRNKGLDVEDLNIRFLKPKNEENPYIKIITEMKTAPYVNSKNENRKSNISFKEAMIKLKNEIVDARGEFDIKDWLNANFKNKVGYIQLRINSAMSNGDQELKNKLQNQLKIVKMVNYAEKIAELYSLKEQAIKEGDNVTLQYAEVNLKKYAENIIQSGILDEELDLMDEELKDAYYKVLEEIDNILDEYKVQEVREDENIDENQNILEDDGLEEPEEEEQDEEIDPRDVDEKQMLENCNIIIDNLFEMLESQVITINDILYCKDWVTQLQKEAIAINYRRLPNSLEAIREELEFVISYYYQINDYGIMLGENINIFDLFDEDLSEYETEIRENIKQIKTSLKILRNQALKLKVKKEKVYIEEIEEDEDEDYKIHM